MNLKAKGLAPVLSALAMALLLTVVARQIDVEAQQPDYTAQCSNGIAVRDPQNNPALIEDCAALLASKDVLAADPPLNWSADTSIEEWSGVELGSTLDGGYFRNRVVGLQHPGRLTGSMPPELGNLSNLLWLNLRNNQLTGSIPTRTGQPLQPGKVEPQQQPTDRQHPTRIRQPLQPGRVEPQR